MVWDPSSPIILMHLDAIFYIFLQQKFHLQRSKANDPAYRVEVHAVHLWIQSGASFRELQAAFFWVQTRCPVASKIADRCRDAALC